MKKRATVVAITLVLAGCGSGSGEDAGRGSEQSSPLSEFLGYDNVDYESPEGQAKMIEDQRIANEKIVACMAKEGFDYTPDNPDQTVSFNGADSEGIEWDSDEFVAKYGFGITTQRWEQRVVGSDLVGYDDDQVDYEYVDPNQAYLEGLSEAEQVAFSEALYGNDPGFEWDESLSDEENEAAMDEFYQDFTPTGCMNEAYNGDNKVNEFYTEFGDEMEAMWESVQNDPRVLAKSDEVKACVEGKGMTYVAEDDVWELWDDELNEIEGEVVYPGNEFDETDFETMSQDEVDALFSEPAVMSDKGKALLAELQSEEIALAVATNECGGGWRNNQELYAEVQAEYEQDFLDKNADVLAEFAGAGATPGD